MENFSDTAEVAWSTDDGKQTFCVPMASVLHVFIYNKDAFDKVGITAPPKTWDEFYADLDKIKADGTYIPLDIGTHDQWEAATMGYQNIGPNYWKGEEGRKALIAGTEKLTDPEWVEPYAQLAKWKPYLADGFQSQTDSDSTNLFENGRAAIYPAGSWAISSFEQNPDLKMGTFPPPLQKEGDQCYISDQPDHGAARDVEADAVDRVQRPARRVESLGEPADAEQGRLAGHGHVGSPIFQQRVRWRGPAGISTTGSLHRASASGQRGSNGQPGGSA